MFSIFYITIVINSTINWSAIITRYHFAYMSDPDLYYLKSLDFNKQLLYEKYKDDKDWMNYRSHVRSILDNTSTQPILSTRLYDWQLKAALE